MLSYIDSRVKHYVVVYSNTCVESSSLFTTYMLYNTGFNSAACDFQCKDMMVLST